MSYREAVDCFQENINLFADSSTQPEKYNLYNGLAVLAETLEQDMIEIKRLLRAIAQAQQRR